MVREVGKQQQQQQQRRRCENLGWPKYGWVLVALQFMSAAAVLVCLGWYGLDGEGKGNGNGNGGGRGFPKEFACWLYVSAAAFTILCLVVAFATTRPHVYEVFVSDGLQLAFWLASTCKLIQYIVTSAIRFGKKCPGSDPSCPAAQIVLVFAVELCLISAAKIIVAHTLYRRIAHTRKAEPEDSEKQFTASGP